MKTHQALLGMFCLLATAAVARPIPERVQSAKKVVVNRMTSSFPIPAWVVDKSKCVAALKVVKAGLGWGGQGSTGLVTCRTDENVWSEPSFFHVSGVNFGFQIGVQFLESVILFITDFARELLNHPTFQVGAEASFAAGPVGGGPEVGQLPDASLLSYQRAFGLYAGATINGFVLSHDSALNERAYGQEVFASELLKTPGAQAPAAVKPFVDTMNTYLPAK